ncbi:DUF6279 family lipoprotein [Polaromonas sp. SM01]|uniref:DUF6279 family lipoprotein n=1 Tax=Polaromonas sp. SM01 TaxID=3085630 RepID=UPI0029826542|nr:DUF6279 family lipoprotein [Polaromonas sp. SM01]MDW5444212.1 DUF6279 family lipoprotein [Polaromonas sp. SM01]
MKFPVHFFGGARFARFGKPWRIIGLLTLLVLLQACSAVKMAYNQAHELAYWQLDGYFDFSDAQTTKVREELVQVHQWHRNTQLPTYIEALKKWQSLLPGELDEAQVCALVEDVRGKLLAISDRSEIVLTELATTLAPEQLDHLKRKFSKLNTAYRRDFLEGSPQSLLDKRVKKAVSRAETLYGPLEDKQLAVIRHHLAQSVFDAKLSLAEHQRRQQDALQTLAPLIASSATAKQAQPAIRAYFERSLNSPDPAFRSYQDRLTRDSCKTFAALHNSTSAAQRAQAVQTLKGYAQDFKTLAGPRL